MSHPVAVAEYVSSAEAAGLRYVTDAMPGIRRKRHGRGFTYIAPDGQVIRDARASGAFGRSSFRRRGPTSGSVRSERPPAGHGARRARAQAVSLPSEVPRAARRHEVRADVGFSDVLWKIRERVERDIALAGPAAREGDGDGRLAARAHAHSRRHRGVRAGEQVVRPHDAAQTARRDRRARSCVRVPRQERRRARRRA